MKKGFLWFVTVVFLPAAAGAQDLPTLQISNGVGAASISWTAGTDVAAALQFTTNLLRPIVWSDQQWALFGGTTNVPPAQPVQFFRVAPVLPIFRYSIFYNVNLEIDPGQAMTFAGPVFCNQSIWEGSDVCTFNSSVTAVGTNAAQVADPFADNFNGNGAPTFDGGQPVSHAAPLSLTSFGTNYSPAAMNSILELPPSPYFWGQPATYSSNGLIYLANGCDLVISNFASGTNFGTYLLKGTNLTVYYQDYGLTQVSYDYYMITNGNNQTSFITNSISPTLLGHNTNIYYAGFSWVTNVIFYDWREGWNGGSGPPKVVQAVQIDMNLLNRWLTNTIATNSGYGIDQLHVLHQGSHIGSIYVCDSVPLSSSQLPAVRVTNGGQLPNPGGSQRGMTVATPLPIYVWKDYNCTNTIGGVTYSGLGTTNTAFTTLPAALMGDAITILSDNWHDIPITKLPVPTSTTVNAALFAGIVPGNPNVNQSYSGGMENFMRLLENWNSSSTILTINGSFVAPFYSQYATNSWQPTGGFYNAPVRKFAYDLNFNNFADLPPLTPFVENYLSP